MSEKYSNYEKSKLSDEDLLEFQHVKQPPAKDEEVIGTIFDGISEQLSEHFASNLHGGFEYAINWDRIPVDPVEIVRIGATLRIFQDNFNKMLKKYAMVISAKDMEFRVGKVSFKRGDEKIWVKAEEIEEELDT